MSKKKKPREYDFIFRLQKFYKKYQISYVISNFSKTGNGKNEILMTSINLIFVHNYQTITNS